MPLAPTGTAPADTPVGPARDPPPGARPCRPTTTPPTRPEARRRPPPSTTTRPRPRPPPGRAATGAPTNAAGSRTHGPRVRAPASAGRATRATRLRPPPRPGPVRRSASAAPHDRQTRSDPAGATRQRQVGIRVAQRPPACRHPTRATPPTVGVVTARRGPGRGSVGTNARGLARNRARARGERRLRGWASRHTATLGRAGDRPRPAHRRPVDDAPTARAAVDRPHLRA